MNVTVTAAELADVIKAEPAYMALAKTMGGFWCSSERQMLAVAVIKAHAAGTLFQGRSLSLDFENGLVTTVSDAWRLLDIDPDSTATRS